MVKQSYLVCTAALLFAVAACDQSTGPSTGLTQADANQLAADMDAVSTLGITDFGLGPSFSVGVEGSGASASVAAVPTTFSNTFDVTRQCPKGGNVRIAGTASGTGDRATHSLSLHTVATRTDTECAFETRKGVLALTGSIVYDATLNIVNGALSGPQTATHEGSFHWVRGAESGDCVVKLTSSFDPTTHTATVKGEFCGHRVDVTRTRGS